MTFVVTEKGRNEAMAKEINIPKIEFCEVVRMKMKNRILMCRFRKENAKKRHIKNKNEGFMLKGGEQK